MYSVLPNSGWKSFSVLIHNISAFTLHANPLLYMWERLIHTHHRTWYIRLPSRLLVCKSASNLYVYRCPPPPHASLSPFSPDNFTPPPPQANNLNQFLARPPQQPSASGPAYTNMLTGLKNRGSAVTSALRNHTCPCTHLALHTMPSAAMCMLMPMVQ